MVARDLQNFANVDLASVSGKNIKQIKASPQYQAELAKRSGAEKIAFEKNTEELVGKFNTRLKEANEFYSRVISPYNEGMLAKLGQKADSNLFTALGELGIAGKSSIDPSDLFRKIGNITFQNGSDRFYQRVESSCWFTMMRVVKVKNYLTRCVVVLFTMLILILLLIHEQTQELS